MKYLICSIALISMSLPALNNYHYQLISIQGIKEKYPAIENKLPFDETAKVELVAKDIYAIIHRNATDEWPHSNVGIVIGDKDVLVIDACYLPSQARDDIALIKKLTSKPVKYLVYTHWHFDHNNGATAYVDSFPNIQIVTEKESQKFVELNGIWWSMMTTAPNSAKRTALKKLEDELTQGSDTTGRKFSENEIDERKKVILQRKNELVELSNLKVIKPNKVFEDKMEVQLGNRIVHLKDWGKANSPHDITVYIPDEKILFTGDIVVQSPLPYTGASWPLPWVKVLKQLEAIPAKKVVPGHGPVLTDFAYVKQVRLFFEDAIQKTEIMIREGKTLIEIQKQINLDNHLQRPWNNNQEALNDFKTTVDVLVERIWRGLRGQG